MRIHRMTGIAIASLLTVLAIAPVVFTQSVSATDYQYSRSYVLHPDADTSSTWTAHPNNGIFWNKVGTNDTNTTMIYSTAINQVCKMTFANLTSIPDEAIKNHSVKLNLTMWIIARANFSGSSATYQLVIMTYAYQQMWTTILAATGVWKNYSLKSTICTYHQNEWYPACINYTSVWLTSGPAMGKMLVTEVGLLIDVFEPITSQSISFGTLGLFGILIFLVTVAIVKVVKVKEVKR